MTGVVVQFKVDGLQEAQKQIGQVGDQLKKLGDAANDAHTRGVKPFTESLEKSAKSLVSFGDSLSRVGNKLTIGVTLPIVAASAAMIKAGADAIESDNLFQVAMGGMADKAMAFSKTLREQLGLNEYETRKQIGVFYQMTSSMGLSQKAAYAVSEGLTRLTGDMASFFNLSPDEAFQKLQSGITGEIMPLRQLGIIVSETSIKQAAMTHGLIQQGQEMTEQQKVIARYLAIVDQTKNAQGDLARTMDSPVNQMRIMSSVFKQQSIELGQALLPAWTTFMNDVIKPAIGHFQDFINWFKKLTPEMQNFAIGTTVATVALGPFLKVLGLTLKMTGLLAGAQGLLGLVNLVRGAAFGAFITGIYSASAALMAYGAAVAGAVYMGVLLRESMYSFKGAVDRTNAIFKGMGQDISDSFTGMADNVKKSMEGVFSVSQESTKKTQADIDAMVKKIIADYQKGAQEAADSFGKITKAGQQSEISQIQSQQKIDDSRRKSDKLAQQLAGTYADLQDGIAQHDIANIQKLYQYDLQAQAQMLEAEKAHYQAMGDDGVKAVDRINGELQKLQQQIEQRTFGYGVRRAIMEFTDQVTNLGNVAYTIVGGAFQSLQGVISNFIQTGKFKFGDFLDYMKKAIADFLASAVVNKLVQFLASAMGISTPGYSFASGSSGGSFMSGVGQIFSSGSSGGSFLSGASSLFSGGSAAAGSSGQFLASAAAGNTGSGFAGVSSAYSGSGGGMFSGLQSSISNIANTNVSLPGLGSIGTVASLAKGAGAGFVGNQLASMLFGSQGLGADIGGGVGGAIGFAVGGPIGAGVGSFIGTAIGGLFGNDKQYPYVRADVALAGGKAVVNNVTQLDANAQQVSGITQLGNAVAAGVNQVLQSLGIHQASGAGTSIGTASGRPGSILGTGYFAGRPGTFSGGAAYTGLSDPSAAVQDAITYSLGRIPQAVAKLAQQGINIPSFATGGRKVFVEPTLIQVGERPEEISVRALDADYNTGVSNSPDTATVRAAQVARQVARQERRQTLVNLNISGPAVFDDLSATTFASMIRDRLNMMALRGYS